MDLIIRWFLYFIIYAFFGYIAEVCYVGVLTKKITNRGYLFGPVVPIYGVGAVLIILALEWAYNLGSWYGPVLVFVLGFLLTSALEYLTSFLMEVLFHRRWWDYSDKLLNINGRVCLRNSTLFGICVILVMYLLQPYVVIKATDLVMSNIWSKYLVFTLILAIFILDTVISTTKNIKLTAILKKLDELSKRAQAKAFESKELIADELKKAKDYIQSTNAFEKLQSLTKRFPSLKLTDHVTKKRVSINDAISKFKSVLNKDNSEEK